ncbi:MAG: protein kinase [Planctomycetes bacterium]|nr:protein kinase [Planctomycetota bacterium]
MPDPNDVRFGRIALASGFLSHEQLEEGLRLAGLSPGRPLPDVLIECGHLTPQQSQAIRQIQQLTGVVEAAAPAAASPAPDLARRPAPAVTPRSSVPAPASSAPAAARSPAAGPPSSISLSTIRPALPSAGDAPSVALPAPPRSLPDDALLEPVTEGGTPIPLWTAPTAPSRGASASPAPAPASTPGGSASSVGPPSRETTRPMSLFGKLILRRGWATEAQVSEGLRLQQESELGGRARQLGEILVEKGVLTVQQVKELLAEQNKCILKCEGCGTKYNVSGLEPGKTIKCMKCGANLVVPKRIVSPGVEGTVHLHPSGDPLVGKVLGGCKIMQKVGKGGMASVYKAKHLGLDKLFAVKILPPASAANEDLIKRFISEARAMAKISHPNIVQVHNVAREQGYNFIVMDLVEGRTVTEVLAELRRILPDDALRIIAETARGLGVAHKHQIVHRDVKPDNIMMSPKGEVKVMDFGLAQDVQTATGSKGQAANPMMIAGTPYYMSPEHWSGKGVDARSDIYSLGVTLYYILTGHKPFVAGDTLALMQLHARGEIPSPKKYVDNLADSIISVIFKMMAKKPSARYQNAEELLKDLDRIKSGLEPLAMQAGGGKSVECGFCQTLNPLGAKKCSVCGEYLGRSDAKIDLVLMDDEFYCPRCKSLQRRGQQGCAQCGAAFCANCFVALASLEGYCKPCYAQLPPPPTQDPGQRRARR